MKAQGYPVSIAGVAEFYHDFLDVLIVDSKDGAEAEELQKSGMRAHCTKTMMRTAEDRLALATETLALALRPKSSQAVEQA
jgi:hypothetical protein